MRGGLTLAFTALLWTLFAAEVPAQSKLEFAPPTLPWLPSWNSSEPQTPVSLPSAATELPPASLPPPAGSPPPAAVPEMLPAPSGVQQQQPTLPAPQDASPHVPAGSSIPEPIVPETLPPTESNAPTESSSWFLPSTIPIWSIPEEWEGSFEVGINGTEGNAESFSFRTGGKIKRKIEKWEFTTDFIYAKTLSSGIETQHNALFNSGYERFFGDGPWSHFGKVNLEYDEFKAFDLRLALNTGLGYQFFKTETVGLKGRFGAGVSHEFDSPDDRWVPEAVFGGDYSHQISKRQKLTLTTDYFPEWEDFTSYRLVTDLGWELFLDEASNLSLKLSVNDRYDSTPNGRKPNDVIYSLLLLWKV